jgi:hypothetical protein
MIDEKNKGENFNIICMRRLAERKERKAWWVIYDLPSGKKDRNAIQVPDDHLVQTRIEKELL